MGLLGPLACNLQAGQKCKAAESWLLHVCLFQAGSTATAAAWTDMHASVYYLDPFATIWRKYFFPCLLLACAQSHQGTKVC